MNPVVIPEDPLRLSLKQWLGKALRLPLRESCRRIARLMLGTPLNIIRIAHLRRLARRSGKRLHLLILTDRLGDIIAAEPAARALREPDELVVWLLRDRFTGALAFARPVVDAVVPVGSYTETIVLRRLFAGSRISFLQLDQSQCNMFGFLCVNPNPAALSVFNFYDNQRALCDVYALVGSGKPAADRPKLWPDPAFDPQPFLSTLFAEPGRPLLLLHAMSDETVRSWTAERARELAGLLLAHTQSNVLELGLTPVLEEGPRVQCLRNRLELAQQFAIFPAAQLFIGVDSGFAHVANASGVPCIFLLGAYRGFDGYLPWRLRPGDRVIRTAEQVHTVEASAVMAEAASMLGAAASCPEGEV